MSARVLVVDDVLPNVKLLAAKLTREYFDVITAMCWGSNTGKSAAASAIGANAGALTGLIRTAVSAAFRSNRLGRALGVQTSVTFCRA